MGERISETPEELTTVYKFPRVIRKWFTYRCPEEGDNSIRWEKRLPHMHCLHTEDSTPSGIYFHYNDPEVVILIWHEYGTVTGYEKFYGAESIRSGAIHHRLVSVRQVLQLFIFLGTFSK